LVPHKSPGPMRAAMLIWPRCVSGTMRERTKSIGWFTTARGPGSLNLFRTLLEWVHNGDIEAKVSFVFINRDVKGNTYRQRLIDMAVEEEIPVIIFPSDSFRPDLKRKDLDEWRDAYGEGLRKCIADHPMDFGVLAGYMLIIDRITCRRYDIINLHPALPNTYTGTWEEIVGKVVENGDPCYGAMVHICSPELDRGAIVAYDSFPTEPILNETIPAEEKARRVRAEELRREAPLLMTSIKMLVDEQVSIRCGKVYDRDGAEVEGCLDLSDRVSLALKRKG
jgi:phosphoribosylglycinamide formyltransferase 1